MAWDPGHGRVVVSPPCAGLAKLATLAKLAKLAKLAIFWRARSRLYQRNFARKYVFDSIFQALQNLHSFAPLQSQKFRKKSA